MLRLGWTQTTWTLTPKVSEVKVFGKIPNFEMSLSLGNGTVVNVPFTFGFTFLPKTWRNLSRPSLGLDHLLCVNVNARWVDSAQQ